MPQYRRSADPLTMCWPTGGGQSQGRFVVPGCGALSFPGPDTTPMGMVVLPHGPAQLLVPLARSYRV